MQTLQKVKKNFRTPKGICCAITGLFVMMICVVGICRYDAGNCSFGGIAKENVVVSDGGKCRQCGKKLEYKGGYFCSRGCREDYADEYYGERYGKAKCRSCGKEFIKNTAYSYFCSPQCKYEYFEDMKMVNAAEEWRLGK